MPALSLPSTLLIFALQSVVLSGAGVAAQIWWRRRTGRGVSPLGALVLLALVPCALGYAAFICYFIHPVAGHVFSWSALAAILGTLGHAALRPPPRDQRPVLHARILALMALTGAFHLSALFIHTKPTFTGTAQHRFLANIPGDNEIPRIFAERLYIGMSPRAIGGDWLSSDRPPLQTGIALITLPALRALDYGIDKACGTAGAWFQLLWIPALWAFLRWLGLTERAALAATAAMAGTGFLLFNTVYVWPKLASAALVLLGFCVKLADAREIAPRRRAPLLGALAAAGALAHGGVMFSLLPMAALAAWRPRRWRRWALAAAVFFAAYLPWIAYQRLYEPPGNRLIKWHLAGQIAPDERGVLQTLIEEYRALGWERALEVRRDNLRDLFRGHWDRALVPFDAATRQVLREDEFFRLFRTPAAWLLGVLAVPWLVWRYFRARSEWHERIDRHGIALGWLGATIVVWTTLMFLPGGTLVHQGSYVAPLLLLGLLAAWTMLASRAAFLALALVQTVLFALTWLPAGPGGGAPAEFPLAATAVFGLAIVALAAESLLTPEEAARVAERLGALRAWSQSPQARLTLPALAALAPLFFLRKPHALTTPQLWAEDGSIFLVQAEVLGARAFTEHYMGYLHTLPRIVAAIAPRLLDPAWWPLFYNGVAFGVWLLVASRIFSPRLALPGKPWLVLALVAVPHSGEVMFNITNLQWITALALALQPMLAPPRTDGERRIDLVVLALLGLTGPFAVVLFPLYVWRWLHEPDDGSLAPMLVVAGAAALQAWFIHTAGPRFEHQDLALRAWPAIEIIARRLIVWPLLGQDLATNLPPAAVGGIGVALIGGLLGWALRPHPLQLARGQIATALALLTAAALYRSRPDTWDGDNLVFADRYFYLPRVLLVWLLVLEFDALPRLVAHVARGACLAIALVHAPSYITPPPTDYEWAKHVEPIRRGTPAKIPTLPENWTFEYPGRTPPR